MLEASCAAWRKYSVHDREYREEGFVNPEIVRTR